MGGIVDCGSNTAYSSEFLSVSSSKFLRVQMIKNKTFKLSMMYMINRLQICTTKNKNNKNCPKGTLLSKETLPYN